MYVLSIHLLIDAVLADFTYRPNKRFPCTMFVYAIHSQFHNIDALHLNVGALGRLAESLEDTGGDLTRSQLDGTLKVLGQNAVHGVLPKDGAGNLSGKELLNGGRVGVGLGIDVGDDGDARLLEFNVLQNLLEGRHGGGHKVGVEGTGDGQLDGHAGLELGLGNLGDDVARLGGTGDGVVAIAKVVGNLDGLAGLLGGGLADVGDDVLAEADDGDHAGVDGVGGGLHGLATGLGDADTVGEVESAGVAKGGVLAEAEAHGAGGGVDGVLALLLLELLDGGHGGDEDGGLGNLGGVQNLLGSVGALLEEVVAEDLGGLIEQSLGCRNLLAELTAHTDELSALPGEHEANLGREVVKVVVVTGSHGGGRGRVAPSLGPLGPAGLLLGGLGTKDGRRRGGADGGMSGRGKGRASARRHGGNEEERHGGVAGHGLVC